MEQTFNITETSRKTLLQFLQGYSLEQLNKIPMGYSNNLIWNIGHIIVVQQMLVYRLSGLPMMVSEELVEKYKRGTKPEGEATQEDIEEIQALLFDTISKTREDLEKNIFENYHEFTTMNGHTLRTVQDAISFNVYHEAVHTGVMMGIRKFI